MLGNALEKTEGVDLIRFTWRSALTAKYDVFHFHWPEALLDGRSPARRWGKQLAFRMLLIRLRITRIPIVRTVHNMNLPTGLKPRVVRLLEAVGRSDDVPDPLE